MHLNSSHVFSSLSFHTRTLGSNFLRRLFVALNRISITNSFVFWYTLFTGNNLDIMNLVYVIEVYMCTVTYEAQIGPSISQFFYLQCIISLIKCAFLDDLHVTSVGH